MLTAALPVISSAGHRQQQAELSGACPWHQPSPLPWFISFIRAEWLLCEGNKALSAALREPGGGESLACCCGAVWGQETQAGAGCPDTSQDRSSREQQRCFPESEPISGFSPVPYSPKISILYSLALQPIPLPPKKNQSYFSQFALCSTFLLLGFPLTPPLLSSDQFYVLQSSS